MSRKGENIYKRKDGRWEARFIDCYKDGKAKYRSVYGKTYSEAKEKRAKIIFSFGVNRQFDVTTSYEFNEICLLWLKNRKPEIKESTYTRYVRIIHKYILPNLKTQKLNNIDSDIVNSMTDKLKHNLSDKTVSTVMCVFKSIWKYGRIEGYPCAELNYDTFRIKSQRKATVIPPQKREKLEAVLIDKNDLVSMGIVFTLFTGVRIGELCGLRWGDFDFENGYVYIRRTIERISDLSSSNKKTKVIISTPKTENSKRIIPLPDFLIEYIIKFRDNDEKYILTSSTKHTEPHSFYIKYKRLLHNNNIGDYTFHELRHTFATQCVDKGFDIKSLSMILGHSSVNTTMNLYVHPTLQMQKRQMELLDPINYSPSK